MKMAPAALVYSSVVLRNSVQLALRIAALSNLKVLAFDVQNAYLTAKFREKIWTIAGPEIGSKAGQIMIIVRVLYGLNHWVQHSEHYWLKHSMTLDTSLQKLTQMYGFDLGLRVMALNTMSWYCVMWTMF